MTIGLKKRMEIGDTRFAGAPATPGVPDFPKPRKTPATAFGCPDVCLPGSKGLSRSGANLTGVWGPFGDLLTLAARPGTENLLFAGRESIAELDAAKGLPEWVQVARSGKYWDVRWETPVDLNLDLFRAVITRFQADGILLHFDLNHASVWRDSAPAQAWIDRLEIRGDALYAHIKEWTEMGAENVSKKYYRYVSPTFVWSAVDRKSGKRGPALHSVALTNTPVIVDIEPLTLAAGGQAPPQGDENMERLRKWLAERGVTLAADADDTAILAALTAHASALADAIPQKVATALGHSDDKTPMSADAAVAAVAAMSAAVPAPIAQTLGHKDAAPMTLAAAQAGIMALQSKVPVSDADRVELATLRTKTFTDRLDSAVGKGLATPKQREVLLSQHGQDATRLVAIATLETLEAGVPSGPLAPDLPGAPRPGAASTETELSVFSQLGIDPQDMKETAHA